MPWPRIAFRAIAGLIGLAVVLMVFSRVYGNSARLPLAAIGLVYVSVRAFSINLSLRLNESEFALRREIEAIKEATVPGFSADPEAVERERTKLSNAKATLYTEAVFVILVALVCTFQIVRALF